MSENVKTARRKGRGREGRIAARNAEVKQHTPAASGQVGGQYKPLTDKELQDILDTAYRILEEIGMAEVPQVVMDETLSQMPAKSLRSMAATLNMILRLAVTKFTSVRVVQQCKHLMLIQVSTVRRRSKTSMILRD